MVRLGLFSLSVLVLTLTMSVDAAPPKAAPAATPAAPSAGLALLDAERAALKTLVVVADISTPKSNNKWATFPMNFWYKAPDKYKTEIKTGGFEGDLIFVADGTVLWEYATKKKEAVKGDQKATIARIKSEGPSDLLNVLATPSLKLAELFSEKALPDAADGGKVIELTPVKPIKAYERIVLRTTADGKQPVFAEATLKGKTIAKVNFKTYTKDGEVADSNFVFTVPAGVKVK